jgi:hypothetical protein
VQLHDGVAGVSPTGDGAPAALAAVGALIVLGVAAALIGRQARRRAALA